MDFEYLALLAIFTGLIIAFAAGCARLAGSRIANGDKS
jgi:hypothetical protein